ncbi:MAG: DUF2752 domain-containing protein [Verrucomicrobiota bacterium]|jgi:hypothetical protein
MKSRQLLAASVVASFAAMVLALPVIQWLHLQSVAVCPFHALTGLPCPTCGYSRDFYLVAHGNLAAAITFQPFVLMIVLLSAVAAAHAALSLIRQSDLKMPGLLVRSIWITLALSWAWNLCHQI